MIKLVKKQNQSETISDETKENYKTKKQRGFTRKLQNSNLLTSITLKGIIIITIMYGFLTHDQQMVRLLDKIVDLLDKIIGTA